MDDIKGYEINEYIGVVRLRDNRYTNFLRGLLTGNRKQSAAHTDFGYFTHTADVGEPALAGSTVYNAKHQTYILRASCTNMWYTHDEFHAVWRTMRGDFVLRTNAHFTSEGEPHRKMGWIVRTSLDDNATYADAVVSGNGMASLQFRRTKGGQTEMLISPAKVPDMDSVRTTRTHIHHVGGAFRRAVYSHRTRRY